MKLPRWARGDGQLALPRTIALQNGTGLACVLFLYLMLPSYGAGDLASHGIRSSDVVALAGIGAAAVAMAGLLLAVTGWRPGWPAVCGALSLAAVALVVPVLLPVTSHSFVLIAGLALAVGGFAAGVGQLTEQTEAVDGVGQEQRSAAVGSIMKWHLLGGVVIGGVGAGSWQVGQLVLAVLLAVLAVVVAVRRRTPAPAPRERYYGLRRLFRETGSGSVIVGLGQAAWVVMYVLPGLHEMAPWWIALYAVVAQVVAAGVMARFARAVDRNQQWVARVSAGFLLVGILGVAIVPATLTGAAAICIGLAFFVLGEVSANLFVTAIEGMISLEAGGRRSQLLGHSIKFLAVGLATWAVAKVAGILTEDFGRVVGPVVLGVGIVFAFAATFGVCFALLRARHRPTA